MDLSPKNHAITKTKDFFYKICKYCYLIGAENFFFEPLKFSRLFTSAHVVISKITIIMICLLIVGEYGAHFTQKNLSEKQSSDLLWFSMLQPMFVTVALVFDQHAEEIRKNLFTLIVDFKKVYNDEATERKMIKTCKSHIFIYFFFLYTSVVSYGFDGLTQVFFKNSTFTTVVTIWPDIDDPSRLAGLVRVVSYITWCIFVTRISASFLLVIPTTICLVSQYKTLCSYFYSLNGIFDKNISQEEKEKEYEAAFKVGIKLHSDTLWCTRQNHKIFHVLYGVQILVNITGLVILMSQMVNSYRTLSNTLPIVLTASCVLFSTGLIVWDAGDITVEASKVPTAMFGSGWHNCGRQSTQRIRQLLCIAITVGQKPVVLRGFGIIGLSYESYLQIVKSSYSVFSVLY